MTTKGVRWVAVFLVVGLPAAACTSSDDDDAGVAEGTSDDGDYLAQVSEVEQARADVFREVGETLNRRYSDRQGFFEAVGTMDRSRVDDLIEAARRPSTPTITLPGW